MSASITRPPPSGVRGVRLWRAARGIGVAATLGLIVGLFWVPDLALALLWDIVIPLVPASLLVSPALWRNVCPLATLNMLPNRLGTRWLAGRRFATRANVAGIVLLALLVPARRVVFNTDGTALAVTILGIAVTALVLGALFEMKAGFCNAMCPVLPVERLYGQHPLVEVGNPHCTPCTLCATACLDIAARKSIATVLGPARKSVAWLTTPFGAFAAAFPGFVLGYFTARNGPLGSAGSVYLGIAGWAGGSYLATTVAVRAWNVSSAAAIRALAAAAAGLYYWFASAAFAARLGVGGFGTTALRTATLGLVAIWLSSASRRRAPMP